jgi:hypothetical protein
MLYFLPKLSIGDFSVQSIRLLFKRNFLRNSNSAKLPRVNCSATSKFGIQTGTMSVSSELSNSVLMNWDADNPNNKFNPPRTTSLRRLTQTKSCS